MGVQQLVSGLGLGRWVFRAGRCTTGQVELSLDLDLKIGDKGI